MKLIDVSLVTGYVIASTIAILLVKLHAGNAVQEWKQSPGLTAPVLLLLFGAFLYAASFLLWMFILARNELSVVYPMMIGLTLAATTAAAWFFLKEPIDTTRVIGILVIFVGIYFVIHGNVF